MTAGDAAYGQAADHWDRTEYRQASPLYVAATQAYGEALTIATRGAQAAAAQESQGEADRAKGQAAGAQAAGLAPTEWEQAEAVLVAGAGGMGSPRLYRSRDTVSGGRGMLCGCGDPRLRAGGSRPSGRAALETAAHARAQAQAAQAEPLAREDWTAAEAALGAATTTFTRAGEEDDAARYTTAQGQFAAATTQYEAAQTTAEQETARRAAEQAQTAAEKARAKAQSV